MNKQEEDESMFALFQRLRDRQEGITLIELIVVVAIIGVLAWLITPRVLTALNDSKASSSESVANEILSGLERYAAQNNTYPATADMDAWAEIGPKLSINVSGNTKVADTTTWKYSGSATSFCASFKSKDNAATVMRIEPDLGVQVGGAECAVL